MVITLTELAAIAAPASTGESRPAAASGMPMTLYAKAQNRFCRILATVRAEISIAAGTSIGSPRISVMPAVCMATSVPVAMAMPTSAAASAGASLMPSPTMATAPPPASARSRVTCPALSWGSTSATTVVMPSSRATASAAPRLSPEIITLRMPMAARRATASRAPGLTVSPKAITPSTAVSSISHDTLRPAACSVAARSASAAGATMPPSASSRALPRRSRCVPIRPSTPRPGRAVIASATGGGVKGGDAKGGDVKGADVKGGDAKGADAAGPVAERVTPAGAAAGWFAAAPIAAASITARASGCSLPACSAADSDSSASRVVPGAGSASTTTGRPTVSVPVLSKATTVTRCAISSAWASLMSTP